MRPINFHLLVLLFLVVIQNSIFIVIDASDTNNTPVKLLSTETPRKILNLQTNSQEKHENLTSNINSHRETPRRARELPISDVEQSLKGSRNNNINSDNIDTRKSCNTLPLKERNDCHEQYNLQKEQQKHEEEIKELEVQLENVLNKEEQVNQLQQLSQSLWHETQQSRRLRRTSKTPRTIQRLIAGHLTLSNTPIASSTSKNDLVFSTKLKPALVATTENTTLTKESLQTNAITSTTPNANEASNQRKIFSSVSRRRLPVVKISTTSTTKSSLILEGNDSYKKDDDEAFLEDPKESDNWDNGILRLGAGDGKENKLKPNKKLDANKTLSEQVKDGKYGLIEHEIFNKKPKRPGILSYLPNKEFPQDNEKTLGGLNEDDIWLAEDHLLVIKGGGLNDKDKNEPWAPIDGHIELDRPIKIPKNPKFPPPFPIQLGENEPIQFVGDNQVAYGNSPIIRDSTDSALSFYSTGDDKKNQIENESYDKENITPGSDSIKGTTKLSSITDPKQSEDGFIFPDGRPKWIIKNGTLINPFLNFEPFDFPAVPPNGPPDEDQFDEDDPSLYYPPPYSFVYKSNYTNPVPAGPLVPGIVLPPPPNAFSRLEPETTTRKPRPVRPSFRQKVTRLQQYKPKRVFITPAPNKYSTSEMTKYSAPETTYTTSTTTTTTSSPYPIEIDLKKEKTYEVTQSPPSYGRVRYYTPSSRIPTTSTAPIIVQTEPAPVMEITSEPQIKTKPQTDESVSLRTPIYYEYSDTKPTPIPTPEVFYKEILPPTPPPMPTIPLQHSTSALPQLSSEIPQSPLIITTLPAPAVKHYPTRKHKLPKITTIKPVLRKPNKHNTLQGKTYLTPRPYSYNDFASIQPHPEIRPNGIASYDIQTESVKPIYNRKPVPDFNREVNAIRQTLQFFSGQQQADYYQNTQRPQPIYEYSFDATQPNPVGSNPQYDTEPFQPMVKYSPPIDEADGFRAIVYPEVNDKNYYNLINEGNKDTENKLNERIPVQIIYNSTPRPKTEFYESNPQAIPNNYPQANNPWISIEKQVVRELGKNNVLTTTTTVRPPKRQQSRKTEPFPRNKFSGYYYTSPQIATNQGQRTNNRYYEEPFAKHLNEIRKKLGTSQQINPQPQWEYSNKTNIEYIVPQSVYNSNKNLEQIIEEPNNIQSTTPFAEIYWNADNKTQNIQNLQNLEQPIWINQHQPQQLLSLESDINVNNIPYGRPSINPDAEFIEPIRQHSHHKSHREKYKDRSKSIKHHKEPIEQYLREVTPNEQNTPQYTRPNINYYSEMMEPSTRPSQQYRNQQLPQKLHKISGAEAFKQYLNKVVPEKNLPSPQPLIWRQENDTNLNKLQQGRYHTNTNLRGPQQPIFRENLQEFSYQPPQMPQKTQPQRQQQMPCKWPQNCNQYPNINYGVLPGHSLQSDININYGQKLPPLNPNSEFINPYQPFLNDYRQPPQQIQQQQLQRPIYDRRQQIPILSNPNYYQKETYYPNSNNQRPQRPPK